MKTHHRKAKADSIEALKLGKFLANLSGGLDKWEMITAGVISQDPEILNTIKDLVALESIEYELSPNPFHSPAYQNIDDQETMTNPKTKKEKKSDEKCRENQASPIQEEEPKIFIGTIILNDSYGDWLTIPLKSLAQHSIIVGTTGSGKSWLIKHIAPQLQQNGITVIIFDCEGEYGSLVKSCPPGVVWVLTPQTDRDNFLEPPPNVPPKEWLNKLRDIIREVFYLRDGAINLLMDILNKLYQERGIFNGSEDWPTIIDLVKALGKLSFRPGSRFAGYLESLVNRFIGLLYSLPDSLCCKKGYDLTKEKEGKIIIYDTSSLSDSDRNFIVNHKILREATYREKLPPQGMKVAFVVEEAHTLFNSSISERYDLGEPFTFRGVRRHRKRGICYFFCDQAPSELPVSLAANVSNNFVLKIQNGKNIRWVKQSMGLLPNQLEYLSVMPKRQLIFQSGDDYPVPVLVEIPELAFEHVTPEDIEKYMKPILERLEYTPLDETEEIDIRQSADMTRTVATGNRKTEHEQPGQLWKRILEQVAEKGAAQPDEVFENFGNISIWNRRKIIAAIEKQKMVEICSVSSGSRGNRKKYLTITPKGAAFIGADYNKIKLSGKGSLEHRVLQLLISQSMKESDQNAVIEYHFSGKSVDIAEIREDRSIAYEIELQPSHPHVSDNVIKDLDAGFSQVIIIVQNKSAKNQAHKQVVENVEFEKLSKVEFRIVKEFFTKKKQKGRK